MARVELEPYLWDPLHETMSREQLQGLQSQRLVEGVRLLYHQVPFYRQQFDAMAIRPDTIRGIEDLPRLPFTTKDDLRDHYPFGLFATPQADVVRLHASSGTTGKPTVVGYTRADLDLWAGMIARVLAAVGIRPGIVVQNAYGYGLFTGGLGFHYGAEKIGATVVPVSGGNTKRQLMLMEDFGAGLLLCTPSYAILMAEIAREEGIDLERMALAAGLFGAEPWTEGMRQQIEARWGIRAYDTYGLSEIIGPGVATECPHKMGLHIFEDHFFPEVIDPESGEVLPDGERGELVLTALTKQAMPILRYRTRDQTRLHREPCPCGRTLTRMEKITGRTDDMLIIRGANVFPSQVESVLLRVGEVEPHYQLVVARGDNALDMLEVWVEYPERLRADEAGREALQRRLAAELRTTLGLTCQVQLAEPKTLARSEGKAQRVVDRRRL